MKTLYRVFLCFAIFVFFYADKLHGQCSSLSNVTFGVVYNGGNSYTLNFGFTKNGGNPSVEVLYVCGGTETQVACRKDLMDGSYTNSVTITCAATVYGKLVTRASNNCNSGSLCATILSNNLPISLKEFSGKSNNCSNDIRWKVADSKNFKEFEIESSINGADFNTISSIQAQAETRNDGLNQVYSFTDKSNKAKNQFYRLKMIDLDGTAKYSQVISISNECQTPTVGLFPNPMKKSNEIQLEVSNFGEKIQAKLIDITGRTIQSFKLNNGMNKLGIDPFTHGIYWLALKDELNNEKVVKLSVIK